MIKKYLVSPDIMVKTAIEVMNKESIKAVVIVNAEKKVLGVFSDGDMRSYFLKGGDLSANICSAMNKTPILYKSKEIIEFEKRDFIRVIYPIVDDNDHIIDIIDYNKPANPEKESNVLENIPLVIMAGGKGTRLYPYTKILPKPLIPIGDITITERIINSFRRYGCKEVLMILNYKASMIKAYMSDIDKDYSIDFVEETQFLGTAGGLRLVKDLVNTTFFVSNCDILVDADLECIYRTHIEKGNIITFVCSMKDVIIPYGVVETDEDGLIKNMKEKPGFSFLINTGLYMIEPKVLDEIKEGEFIHLPDLAQRYLERGEKVGVYPISEKEWMDMGQFMEMENMKKELGI